jgi:hypothetical protein
LSAQLIEPSSIRVAIEIGVVATSMERVVEPTPLRVGSLT